MTLTETFEAAVADSKTLPEKPDNDTLLEIYSLYKQATTGDAPEKGDYGMFDFVAKAKHDAWSKHKGLSQEKAMEQYVALIARLKS